ncbi:MAG: biotin/lipoyl-containing protein, partial [Myxococcota bacterium]
EELALDGWAVEARLYAEDRSSDLLPSTGTVVDYLEPEVEGVSVDSGVELGSEVGIHYDPMLAKVIAHGIDREEALRRCRRGLRELSVLGLVTNRGFLLEILGHRAFEEAALHTGFLDEHGFFGPADLAADALLAADATVVAGIADRAARRPTPRVPVRFRLDQRSAPGRESAELTVGGTKRELEYAVGHDGQITIFDGAAETPRNERSYRILDRSDADLIVERDGLRHALRVVEGSGAVWVHSAHQDIRVVPHERFPIPGADGPSGAATAPMPGKVISVSVEVGTEVRAGQPLLILEAMKMEHRIEASEAGIVKELRVAEGDQVDADAILVVVEPS